MDMNVGNVESGAVPLYRAIVEALRDEIMEGRYQKTFPSEAQLVRRFAVGRQTVIRAMGELVNQGFVERRRGSGTVVSRRIRQKLGTIGLIMPNLASSPFTAAIAAVCRDVGFSLMFKDVRLVEVTEKHGRAASMMPPFAAVSSKPPYQTTHREGILKLPHDLTTVSHEKLAKGAFALAMELANAEVTGVLMQPVQNVAGFEQINREILAVFKKRRIPLVLVDHDICFPPERSGCDVVSMDNFHAGYAIGRHLLERGAKKIAFLMHEDWAPSVKERLHGLSMAVVEAGFGWNLGRNVILCRPDDANGIARAIRASGEGRACRAYGVDAIACGNDIEAARLLKTLGKLGVSVPDGIRVTGIDDARHAALLSPALTTVRQDFAQIAKIAEERLIWRIRNPGEPPVTIQTHGELIIREST